ncbi:hypothetical protein WJX73_007720 [Symbiochloris irregularis]|uniref:DEAD-box RNA helicase Q domain-containing protein n=1 Tax=Symbiochloris irregularis TaxID=706552 RepID=A0AAW1NNA5_9CHLO
MSEDGKQQPHKKRKSQPKSDLSSDKEAWSRVDVSDDFFVGSLEEFGLDPRLLRGIADLGISTPTPIQRDCLPPAIRDRRDVIGAAQTELASILQQIPGMQQRGGPHKGKHRPQPRPAQEDDQKDGELDEQETRADKQASNLQIFVFSATLTLPQSLRKRLRKAILAVLAPLGCQGSNLGADGTADSWSERYHPPTFREPLAITVAATDFNDARLWISPGVASNYGPCVKLWAPGAHILSASNESDTATQRRSGTSQAVPFVAGGIALYLENATDEIKVYPPPAPAQPIGSAPLGADGSGYQPPAPISSSSSGSENQTDSLIPAPFVDPIKSAPLSQFMTPTAAPDDDEELKSG